MTPKERLRSTGKHVSGIVAENIDDGALDISNVHYRDVLKSIEQTNEEIALAVYDGLTLEHFWLDDGVVHRSLNGKLQSTGPMAAEHFESAIEGWSFDLDVVVVPREEVSLAP